MKKFIIIFAIIIVILIGILYFLPLDFVITNIKPRIENKFNIRIDYSDCSFYIGRKISIDKLKIKDNNGNPFLVVNKIFVSWNILNVYGNGKINLTNITVDNPVVYVSRKKNGSFNFSYLINKKEKSGSEEKRVVHSIITGIKNISVEKFIMDKINVDTIKIQDFKENYIDVFAKKYKQVDIKVLIPEINSENLNLTMRNNLIIKGNLYINKNKSPFDIVSTFVLNREEYNFKGVIDNVKYNFTSIEHVEFNADMKKVSVRSKYIFKKLKISDYFLTDCQGVVDFKLLEKSKDVLQSLNMDSRLLLETAVILNPPELKKIGKKLKLKELAKDEQKFNNVKTHVMIKDGKIIIPEKLTLNRNKLNLFVKGWFALQGSSSEFTVEINSPSLKKNINVPFKNYKTDVNSILKQYLKREVYKKIDKYKDKINKYKDKLDSKFNKEKDKYKEKLKKMFKF